MIEIITTYNDQKAPTYATPGSAAMDIYAYCPNDDIILRPNKTAVLHTGIMLNMTDEPGICALIIPRSGRGCEGLTLANNVGLIDHDYQGIIKLIFRNTSEDVIVIKHNHRVAQLMFIPYFTPRLKIVEYFSNSTQRGANGFGSSGK